MSDVELDRDPPIHVLQVTRGAIWGGGERHVASLLEGFRDRSVRLSLAVFTEAGLAREARRLKVTVHCLPKRFRGDPGPLLGLVRVIRRHRIDIVHTHMTSGNFYGRVAARLSGRSGLVSTLHYVDREALPFLPRVLQRLFFDGDFWMARMCDRIVTTSEHLRRTLLERGISDRKLVTILNGVNLDSTRVDRHAADRLRDELGIVRGTPVVGIVGRLVPVKNQALFLRVAREVLDRGVRARFVVVGDGPLREPLRALRHQLALDEHVVFAGFRDDVMTLLSIFDLCLLTSNSETSAYGVSEPMAMGRPVVATAVGGVPELIEHGVDGWLCPARDAAALADAVCALLADPAAAARMGERAARKVRERLSLDPMMGRLEQVYRQVFLERVASGRSLPASHPSSD
jgi:glycosyltransferase involved in cell wall biosynthesis